MVFGRQTELVRGPREFLREKFTWIYTRYLGEQGVLAQDPQEMDGRCGKLLIKLKPEKIKSWGLE